MIVEGRRVRRLMEILKEKIFFFLVLGFYEVVCYFDGFLWKRFMVVNLFGMLLFFVFGWRVEGVCR